MNTTLQMETSTFNNENNMIEMDEEQIIISIDGNIGSGKSTLVSILKNIFNNVDNVCFLQEPVDTWNEIRDENNVTILELFYKNPKEFAFSFQMMAYISRLSILRKAINNKKYKYIITERCLFTDANVFAKMLYDDKKISRIEYTIYKQWFNEFTDNLPNHKYIYIKTSPNTSYERVVKRNREGEVIPIDYLEKCHDYHEKWLYNNETDSSNEILQLDGNIDINENPNILNIWYESIKNFINL
jgi:deoxyadenosine/deoxycytidine kinase